MTRRRFHPGVGVRQPPAPGFETGKMKHKPATLSIIAYSGGPLNLKAFSEPIILDLDGLKVSRSVPILRDHDRSRVVGHTVSVRPIANQLKARGIASGANGDTAEVVGFGVIGFPWQASLGVTIQSALFVAEGETATANGRTFKGPLLIARRATLREISIVIDAVDENTFVEVVA